MEGRNHAQMSGSIIPLDFLMGVLAVPEDDSFPLSPLEAVIDPFGLSSDLGLKVSIAFDTAAGRRTNLNERKFALILGIPLQK